MRPLLSKGRGFLAILITALLWACSSATGPAGGAPGGSLDNPAGGSSQQVVSAAQPVNPGFPMPNGDPGHNNLWVDLLVSDPVCKEGQEGRYDFLLDGYLRSPASEQNLSGMVMRWIDLASKTYWDTELQNLPMKDHPSFILANDTGHFHMEVSGSYPPTFKALLLPADAAKDKLDQALPCADSACGPEQALGADLTMPSNLDSDALKALPTCESYRLQRDSVLPLFQRKAQ